MAKEVCPTTNEQLSFNNIINSKRIEARAAYFKVFSNDYGLGVAMADKYKESINRFKLQVRKLQRKSDKESKKEAKIINRQIKDMTLKLDEFKDKKPILKRIEKLLMNHVMHVQESQLFGEHVKPETLFNVIKETISIPRSLRFDKLSELDNNTLLSVERQLSRELFHLKKLSNKESKLSWYKDQVMHPLAVARKFDPTGNSYNLIKSTIQLAQNAYSARANYEQTLNDVSLLVKDIVHNQEQISGPGGEFMFLNDIGDLAATEDDIEESAKNIYKFLHDIGDKQLVKLVPSPIIGENKAGKMTWTDQFKMQREQLDGTFRSDFDIWKDKIDKQAKSGLQASGDIQKYVHKVGDKSIVYYYLMIERKGENGEIFNVAYEVPYQQMKTKDGSFVDRLEFAPHKQNTKFWEEFRNRKPSEHLAGISSSNARGQIIMHDGRMPKAWYRATDYKNFTGKKTNKKQLEAGERFTGSTYIKYEVDEAMNKQEGRDPERTGIPVALWQAHAELESMFKEVAQEIIKSNLEVNNGILALLKKSLKDDNINLKTSNINEILADKFGIDIDLLNMNINIVGNDINTARIYTLNSDFSERRNYMPLMYSEPDKLYMLLKSREKAYSMLNTKQTELSGLEGAPITKETLEKKRKLKKRIKDLKSVYKHEDLTVKRVLGVEQSVPKVNQVTAIKAAKHRSSQSNPIPKSDIVKLNGVEEEVVISNGKRKDARVFNDYLQQTFTSIEQNKIKLQLLEAVVNGMPESIKQYSIDQVKAALGRDDMRGFGIFGIDFSDKARGLTDTDLAYYLDVNNKLTSANLLKGPITALTNNFQRFGYGIIEDFDTMWAARQWREADKNGEATKAAAYAGITDEIQTIADGLVPGGLSAEGQEHWASGFWNKTIMTALLLSSSRGKFTTKILRGNNMTSRWWIKIADFLINKDISKFGITLKKPLSEQQSELFKAREEALGDIWLLTRGLATEDQKTGKVTIGITKAEHKGLDKKLGRTFGNSVIDSHLKFSLGGGVISRMMAGVLGIRGLKFDQSEINMRIESIYVAAQIMKKEGSIDPSLKGLDIYRHPKVIAHARLLVNNVMFSMSQANLSKMFRGRIGKTLFKFKPYMWNQMGSEWNIIQAYFDNLKNQNLSMRERTNVLMGIMKNPKGKVQKQMRSLLLYRGTTTFWTTIGTHTLFGAQFMRGITQRLLGYSGANAASRGLEFQLVKVPLNALLTMLMFAGAMDDEDPVYEEFYRNFIPLIINVFLDSLSGDDAFKGVRVYSKGFYEIINAIKESTKPARRSVSGQGMSGF